MIAINAVSAIKLMQKYADCPNCGNDKVGNGQGKLIIEDDTFTRECRCGFNITVDGNGNELTSADRR